MGGGAKGTDDHYCAWLYMGIGIRTQILTLVWQMLYKLTEPSPQPFLHLLLLLLLLNYKFIQHKTTSSSFIEVADHVYDKAASEQEPHC